MARQRNVVFILHRSDKRLHSIKTVVRTVKLSVAVKRETDRAGFGNYGIMEN